MPAERNGGKKVETYRGNGSQGLSGTVQSKEGSMCYPAVIVSVLIVTACVIAYMSREVDKCFDQYFDEIEGKD